MIGFDRGQVLKLPNSVGIEPYRGMIKAVVVLFVEVEWGISVITI